MYCVAAQCLLNMGGRKGVLGFMKLGQLHVVFLFMGGGKSYARRGY